MSKKLLFRLVVLLMTMMCALGASAAEAYACYTPSNTTLTFYCDNDRSTRPGTTYDLNTVNNDPGWYTDGTNVNVTKVVFDTSFADARPTTTFDWFYDMQDLESITGLSYLNTSEVTIMTDMFNSCHKLTSLDLSNFNTAKVTDMALMFANCRGLTSLDLSNFNTDNVTTMELMFASCWALTSLNLNGWNTAKVTNMTKMFYGCTSLTTIYVGTGWSTTSVTHSLYMFYFCTKLVGGMGTTYSDSHIDKAYAHIDGGPSNPGYLTAAGTEAYACYTPSNSTLTFYYDNQRLFRMDTTYSFNPDSWLTDPQWVYIRSYVTQVVFDPSFAFTRPANAYKWFNRFENLQSITGIEYLNTSDITRMDYMFNGCSALTSLDLSHFNTSNVTRMDYMFKDCSSLTSLDLSNFNTANVTDMQYMFSGCSELVTIYVGDGWNTTRYYSSTNMFMNCTSLVGGQGTTYDASHTDKAYAHIDGGPSNPGYFTEWKEAYACYTPSNTTLTFYYDKLRSTRVGTTYDLPDDSAPVWNLATTQVVFDPSFADARPKTTQSWFSYMYDLTTITGIQYLNTSEVTIMHSMFNECRSLTSLDLSGFNTDKVINMANMFFDCSGLESLDVSSFNTANVTSMQGMFYNCSGLESLDVSSFNTANVTLMRDMFFGCSGLTSLDVSSFNTANVNNMRGLFTACSALTSLDLSNFNTDNVTDMQYMFTNCSELVTIYVGDGWNTVRYYSSTNMFMNCTSLVGGQGTTYDASHIDRAYAHIDGGPSNPGYFTEKGPEAYACYTSSNTTLTFYCDNQRASRTGTTYGLNTGNIKPGWHRDGTNANVTKVVFDPSFANARPTSTYYWIYGMRNIQSIAGMSYLNTSEVTDMSWMFSNNPGLTSLDVSCFNTANVTNMSNMFDYCTNLESLDVSSFNTANVTNMSNMFDYCTNLTSLDVSCFNTEKVTDMRGMFWSCSALTSLDLSNFNTANVTDMSNMFWNCSALTSLDLSNFNTAKVTNMTFMFYNCSNLSTIYAGSEWSTAAGTSSSSMFGNCTSLVGGQGTTYDPNHVNAAYAHIDGGPSNPGYFTDPNAPSEPEAYACYTPDNTTLTFYYDNLRSSRSGTTYGLNLGSEGMEWHENPYFFTQVVFDPSFADARPATTSQWFEGMSNVRSITGLEFLNTDSVTDMSNMFYGCRNLLSIDLSHFNTSNVTSMYFMFANCRALTSLDLSSFNTDNVTTMECMFLYCMGLTSVDLSGFTNARVERTSNMFESCYALTTIYADSGWSLPANNYSYAMFNDCTNLVGGKGTTFDANHTDAEYARIDGGPSDPGYFTEKPDQGDVNGDGNVSIADVTALIDYLLSGDASGINLAAADCNQDSGVSIGDVTALIDYLLAGNW